MNKYQDCIIGAGYLSGETHVTHIYSLKKLMEMLGKEGMPEEEIQEFVERNICYCPEDLLLNDLDPMTMS